uniref:Uncharacterized protein n=1 Tax=Sander lucioperca TaxID=283035 RepID=A0A8D0B2M5_SANLU
MGANNSTRRVSFESDENENITVVKGIRVSDSINSNVIQYIAYLLGVDKLFNVLLGMMTLTSPASCSAVTQCHSMFERN